MTILLIILLFNFCAAVDYKGINCEPHIDFKYDGCSIATDVLIDCLITTGLCHRYCIVLYCIVLYCIVSYRIVSYRIVSYCIVLYGIVILYYSILQYNNNNNSIV